MMPPLPPQIARLARTDAGLPVPYVAAWSEEGPFRVHTGKRPPHTRLLCETHTHRGVPQLGQMNLTRQRASILAGLCQVCEQPLPAGPRLLVTLFEPGSTKGPLVREPWACASCLAFSLRVCPGLLGVQRREGLWVVVAPRWGLVGTVTDLAGLATEGKLAPGEPTEGTAIGYLKIIPQHYELLDVSEFLGLPEFTRPV